MKGRGPEFVKVFDEELRRKLKFLDYAPVLHISAATGERTPKLLEMIDRFEADLTQLKEAIRSADAPALHAYFLRSKLNRDAIL